MANHVFEIVGVGKLTINQFQLLTPNEVTSLKVNDSSVQLDMSSTDKDHLFLHRPSTF